CGTSFYFHRLTGERIGALASLAGLDVFADQSADDRETRALPTGRGLGALHESVLDDLFDVSALQAHAACPGRLSALHDAFIYRIDERKLTLFGHDWSSALN